MNSGAGRKPWIVGIMVFVIVLSIFLSVNVKVPITPPLIDGSTVTIVPGVHLIGKLGPAVAYAVETPEGPILFDAGLTDDAEPLKTEMERLGLNWKKLRAIFLTHSHVDHVGGATRLRAETGARVYAGQGEVSVLAAAAPPEAFFSTFKMPGHKLHSTIVDTALQGEETVSFGDVRVQVIATPGHTTGSTCYLVERDGLRVLFSGDVVMRFGKEPLGTYSTYLAPRYRGDATSYLTSLRKLHALPVPDLVLPGHPSSNPGKHSAQMTQQQWTGMLESGIREMEDLIARNAADGANFLDGQPKKLLPDLYYFGDFHGAPVYGFYSKSKLFVVDAPGGPGLNEFLKAQQQKFGLAPVNPFAILLTACGEKETAGLKELVEQSGAQVVASPKGLEVIKKMCPPGTTVLTPDELKEKDWFPVTPIPMDGRGVAPMAYSFVWAEKAVLISGRIPVVIDTETEDELIRQFEDSKPQANAYITSLRRLLSIDPDIWLPSVPIDAQNANLYEGKWKEIMEKNYISVSGILH